MRLSSIAVPLFLFSFTTWLGAVPSATIQLGASVENVRFEHDSKVAFVRVVNRSQKEITAINLSIDITFAGGKVDHFEQMLDLLPLIIARQTDTGVSGEGSLAPGESREIRVDAVSTIQSIHARVDMVTYLDLSAEIDENQDALNRLVSGRNGSARAAQDIAAVVSEAVASSVTPDPSGMAVRQLRKLLDSAVSQHAGERELELRAAISDLQSNGVKADLKGYARRKNDAAKVISVHANVRRVD